MLRLHFYKGILHLVNEEIWMEQPEGYQKQGGYACGLLKSLYCLKQASRAWNETFVNFLKQYYLVRLKSDSYELVSRKDSLIIVIYVDDEEPPLIDSITEREDNK